MPTHRFLGRQIAANAADAAKASQQATWLHQTLFNPDRLQNLCR
jgi:hypothetical protein